MLCEGSGVCIAPIGFDIFKGFKESIIPSCKTCSLHFLLEEKTLHSIPAARNEKENTWEKKK